MPLPIVGSDRRRKSVISVPEILHFPVLIHVNSTPEAEPFRLLEDRSMTNRYSVALTEQRHCATVDLRNMGPELQGSTTRCLRIRAWQELGIRIGACWLVRLSNRHKASPGIGQLASVPVSRVSLGLAVLKGNLGTEIAIQVRSQEC